MKTKLIPAAIIILLIGTSCSVSQVSHSQAMDNEVMGQNKYTVISKFGHPTTMISDTTNNYEAWFYNLDKGNSSITKGGKANKMGNQSSDMNSIYGRSLLGSANSYIYVVFRNGRVIYWSTQGVNMGQKFAGGGGAMAGKIGIIVVLYSVIMAALLVPLLTMNPY